MRSFVRTLACLRETSYKVLTPCFTDHHLTIREEAPVHHLEGLFAMLLLSDDILLQVAVELNIEEVLRIRRVSLAYFLSGLLRLNISFIHLTDM